jgi:hypothetical protein
MLSSDVWSAMLAALREKKRPEVIGTVMKKRS